MAVAGPRAALLALLLSGHVLADFLFQTKGLVEAKGSGSGYALHGAVVFLVGLLVALPLFSLPLLAALAAIAVLHALIDRLKTRLMRAGAGRLAAFFLDQGIHVAVIVAAWSILVRPGGGLVPGAAASGLTARGMAAWVTVAVLAAALAFAATGGSEIVEGTLEGLEETPRDSGYPGAGRLIGILERTLMLFLVFYGQWAAAVLLLTAKSIARFEDLKDRRFAEYYLVGTLTSLLVATATGIVLTRVLGAL